MSHSAISPPSFLCISLPLFTLTLLPSLYISPFTLTLVSTLIFLPLLSSLCFDFLYSSLLWFFSPPFTLCKPKVTGFMGCMHDVGKCQVVDFFFLSFPSFFFPCCVSYLLLACVAEGLDIFVHTSFSQQTWHLFFIVCSKSFGFGGSCFNYGRSEHRASKCPNEEDF
jgi:hypothetical protein